MKKSSVIIGVIAVVILAGILLMVKISYNNQEIGLRKQITAEQDIYQQNFDKQYKVVAQLVQVAERNVEANKAAFKEIYPDLIEGRYSQGDGTLMKMIKESNPQWDMKAIEDMYAKVSTAIESQREDLYNQARKLRDLAREREALIEKFPGSWFISNQKPIEITLITSKNTKEVFKTGEENDIDLFKK
jgi:MFS superfamily sulfate permease-like transporter